MRSLYVLLLNAELFLIVSCRISDSGWMNDLSSEEDEAYVKLHGVHQHIDGTSQNTTFESFRRVMVIRVSNLTFYVKLHPQTDTRLHSQLRTVQIVHDNHTEEHVIHDIQKCQFTGVIMSPVKGVASVNTCPDSPEIYAILITDSGVFYLRPRMIEWTGNKDRPHVLTRKGPSAQEEQLCGALPEEISLEDGNRVAPASSEDSHEEINYTVGENVTVKSRMRRATEGGSKYIETAIFVDRHMYDAIDKTKPPSTITSIVNIVMAILHQVQLIYEYQSMTAYDFKLIIVKFEILRNTKTSPKTGGGNIDSYLDNFCSWQCNRMSSGTSAKDKWDHAIMLTGLDMFKMSGNTKNDKVLGLAWVNGMCRCKYSCTINEGNSAEAAFVIAHEMGHSLGMQHDGSGNQCDSNKYIMSDRTGAGKVNWSKCSNDYVKQADRKGQFKCLENAARPASSAVDIAKLTKLPGEEYPAAQQCQMALSSKHKPYMTEKSPFNDVCRELWCLDGQWATPAHPALDGTECASGKWCRQGSCVTRSSSSKSTTERPQTAATQSDRTTTTARRVTSGSTQGRRWAFRNLYGRFSGIYG